MKKIARYLKKPAINGLESHLKYRLLSMLYVNEFFIGAALVLFAVKLFAK